MQQRPNLFDPRAVLRPVKAWPGNTGASRNVIATASLDGPCARRTAALQVGTKERPSGANKGTASSKEEIDEIVNNLYPPKVCER
jgi:hypothetical protein